MEGVSNEQLKERYQVQGLFAEDKIQLFYSHNERLVIGGVAPVNGPVELPTHAEPPSASGQPYLSRREMGVFNVSHNNGSVTVDGEKVDLAPKEALYIPMGSKKVTFESHDKPVHFYVISAQAVYYSRRL